MMSTAFTSGPRCRNLSVFAVAVRGSLRCDRSCYYYLSKIFQTDCSTKTLQVVLRMRQWLHSALSSSLYMFRTFSWGGEQAGSHKEQPGLSREGVEGDCTQVDSSVRTVRPHTNSTERWRPGEGVKIKSMIITVLHYIVLGGSTRIATLLRKKVFIIQLFMSFRHQLI